MQSIKIGNRSFYIKDYYCSQYGYYIPKNDGKLWLYVNITGACPASCPFCVNPGRKCGRTEFDVQIFMKTLECIRDHIYGVSFTGGEPMLECELLDSAIGVAGSVMNNKIEIDMVTNGMNLNRIPTFRHLELLDSIHISRHRIDDIDNGKLMGIKTPTVDQIRELLLHIKDPARVVFNCVLQKDGINSPDLMAEYLEMAAEAGISNTSFISMIPANGYCMDQFVDPEMFNLENDSRFRVWNHFHDYEYCSCSAGDYRARKGWVRYYYRSPGKEKAPYSRQLVYTENNRLLDGFGGNQIYV